MNHRVTKVLLALIAVALWGLVFQPGFLSNPAQAQSKRMVEYYLGGGPTAGNWSAELDKQLNSAAAKGWRVKAISAANSANGYVHVLYEREQ